MFPVISFERLTRNIINQYNDTLKISKDLFIILQYYIEQYVISILEKANKATIHSGRIKLLPIDIQFITNLLNIN